MKGRLKNDLRKGHGEIFVPKTYDVKIIDQEDHPIYGQRYKVEGEDDWFEENAFEFINKEEKKNDN